MYSSQTSIILNMSSPKGMVNYSDSAVIVTNDLAVSLQTDNEAAMPGKAIPSITTNDKTTMSPPKVQIIRSYRHSLPEFDVVELAKRLGLIGLTPNQDAATLAKSSERQEQVHKDTAKMIHTDRRIAQDGKPLEPDSEAVDHQQDNAVRPPGEQSSRDT